MWSIWKKKIDIKLEGVSFDVQYIRLFIREVFDQTSFKSDYSTTETSHNIGIVHVACLGIPLFNKRKKGAA